MKKANGLRRGMSLVQVEALFDVESESSFTVQPTQDQSSPLTVYRYSLAGYSSAEPFYLLFSASGLYYWGYLYEFTRNQNPIIEAAGIAIGQKEYAE